MNNRILLVDDEPGIRMTLSLLLEDMGYAVESAEDGREALRMFDESRFQVILTDIKMPGLDGIGLLKAVKERDADAEVIMMTGHGDMELAVASLKNGATDFISKPIMDEAVEVALTKAFERIENRNQLRAYTERLEAMVAEQTGKILETERIRAVGQAAEGLASAIMGLPGDLDDDLSYIGDLPCYVSLHDRNLEILAANQLYYERIGAFRGSMSWHSFAGGAASPDTCPVAVTFRTGKGQRSAETLLVNDEEVPVVVYTAPVADQKGHPYLVIELMVDITRIRRLQDAIQYARERYHQLFNEAPCFITVQDPYLRITEANRLFRETFGDLIGEHCYAAYKQRATHCTDCPVRKTFQDGRTHCSEMVVTGQKGEQYNLLVYTSPIRDQDGNITRVMEMSTDITQIHQLRGQLSSLGLMISSISHGVKGMLTGLDGGIYLVNSGLNKDDRELIKEGWDIVQTMVKRIREMILNILFYAKERQMEPERVDVHRFISEIARAFSPKCDQERIAFDWQVDENAGEIRIDPVALRMALANILENALDACREDNAKTDHQIRMRIRREPDALDIAISDNGKGMSAETSSQLFTLFYSSKGNRGTGLGLFVAKKTVEQHNGRISVDSTPGEGTTFRIRLPLGREGGTDAETGSPAPPPAQQPSR